MSKIDLNFHTWNRSAPSAKFFLYSVMYNPSRNTMSEKRYYDIDLRFWRSFNPYNVVVTSCASCDRGLLFCQGNWRNTLRWFIYQDDSPEPNVLPCAELTYNQNKHSFITCAELTYDHNNHSTGFETSGNPSDQLSRRWKPNIKWIINNTAVLLNTFRRVPRGKQTVTESEKLFSPEKHYPAGKIA